MRTLAASWTVALLGYDLAQESSLGPATPRSRPGDRLERWTKRSPRHRDMQVYRDTPIRGKRDDGRIVQDHEPPLATTGRSRVVCCTSRVGTGVLVANMLARTATMLWWFSIDALFDAVMRLGACVSMGSGFLQWSWSRSGDL